MNTKMRGEAIERNYLILIREENGSIRQYFKRFASLESAQAAVDLLVDDRTWSDCSFTIVKVVTDAAQSLWKGGLK